MISELTVLFTIYLFSNLSYNNGVRLPNGRVPTKGQVAANASLIKDTGTNHLKESVDKVVEQFFTDDWKELMGKDLYAAHAVRMDYSFILFYFKEKNGKTQALYCRFFLLTSIVIYYNRKRLRKVMMIGLSGVGYIKSHILV